MRLRNDPLALEKLKTSGLLITEFPFKLDKSSIIELGMGKGEMITELARKNPTKTYIGVEKFATVAARAAKKANEMNLKNFFIICNDVFDLPDLLVGKVNEIWLTFSDPWPKTRHEKRRLTYKSFLNIYKDLLSDNGKLRFKTDNDKLFQYSVESLQKNKWKINVVTENFHGHKSSEFNVMTGYEKKWSDKGKNINYLEATK